MSWTGFFKYLWTVHGPVATICLWLMVLVALIGIFTVNLGLMVVAQLIGILFFLTSIIHSLTRK
jgi:spore maturation protein SpmA